MSNVLRGLARNVAKNRMRRSGMVQICKSSRQGKSIFAKHWRELVTKEGKK